jgi:osmotically inducible lipoprotein OsmB
MTRTMIYAPAMGLLSLAMLAACGTNMEQRAASGAAAGLVVAGPVGAAVGGAAGAVVNEIEEGSPN